MAMSVHCEDFLLEPWSDRYSAEILKQIFCWNLENLKVLSYLILKPWKPYMLLQCSKVPGRQSAWSIDIASEDGPLPIITLLGLGKFFSLWNGWSKLPAFALLGRRWERPAMASLSTLVEQPAGTSEKGIRGREDYRVVPMFELFQRRI